MFNEIVEAYDKHRTRKVHTKPSKVRLFTADNMDHSLPTMLGSSERVEFSGSAAKGLSLMLSQIAANCDQIVVYLVQDET